MAIDLGDLYEKSDKYVPTASYPIEKKTFLKYCHNVPLLRIIFIN